MRNRVAFSILLLGLLFGVAVPQDAKKYSHTEYFEHFQGTTTCMKCHQKQTETFFHSHHYQWRGPAPNIVNAGGKQLGKLNLINDFCTSPTGNWIGLVKNSRGEVISRGCSACHAGNGKVPSEKMDQAQLESIDCLICHASGYRRDLYENEKGGLEWRPILWKNSEGLDSVAKRISTPTRVMCLRCHAASGGGPNYKRGDIEYKLADPDRDFDVHMASEGKNMQCVTCHAGEDHRVRGRGADLTGNEMPNNPLSCDSSGCHGSSPHKLAALNRHAKRVNCTTCHIPSFAREEPTDMIRDWSTPVYIQETDGYTATITLQKNVMPIYAWFNGMTRAQLAGEPVERLADGSVGMMTPVGSREDPKAKIFAFKVHKAKLPLLIGKNWIIPITVEHFFTEGKIDPSIRMAAKEMYGIDNARYTWTETTRYLGIFHGVQPKGKALRCADCHGTQGRMDWKALGYSGNPMKVQATGTK